MVDQVVSVLKDFPGISSIEVGFLEKDRRKRMERKKRKKRKKRKES